MSENELPPSKTDSHTIGTTRRRFLRMTGAVGLLSTTLGTTGTAAPSNATTPPAPETATGGPGRITNLAAYIENPSVFAQHREPTHTTAAIPYGSVETARRSDKKFTALADRFTESEYCTLLNGEWKFSFYERPDRRPADHAATDWETSTVPRPWQIEGYDQGIYANWQETWVHYDPPLDGDLVPTEDGVSIPNVNPTGTYRRSFRVPSGWAGREVFVHFAGVKQAYFVWIDGEYVGFQQGSMTPGEFDITEYVTPGGEHEVTVQVYRFSDGEALEAIDMFRYAGIYRDVYLFSTPSVHVRDFNVNSGLDDAYQDGHLRIDAELANYADAGGETYSIRASLYGPDDRNAHGSGDWHDRGTEAELFGRTTIDSDGGLVSMERTVQSPALWSAEHPNLYTLVLELIAEDGQTTEVLVDKVGFRTYETSRGGPGAQVLVNGEPVTLRGTNRHETDPETGRTVPLETMRADFELMKRFNVNSVRTAHYPNDPTFLRLADEYGVYVMDEACSETHWWEGILAHTEAYHDQAVSRFRRMVLRDRNHASVFSWSTGNEAGTGAEHINMASLALDTDEHLPSDTSKVTGVSNVERFEGAVQGLAPDRIIYHQPNGGGWDVEYSDMLGPRYPDVDTLLGVGDGSNIGDGKRPVVMGEYNHAMGNSLGLVHAMWSDHIQPPVRRARDGAGDGDGVLVGSPTVGVGRTEGAVTLGDDYIEVDGSSALDFATPGFTFAVTFSNLAPNTEIDFVSKGDQYRLGIREGMQFEFSVGDVSVSGKVPSNLARDEWHTLVGVCAADRLLLSLDGSTIGERDHSVTDLPSSDRWVRVGHSGQQGADGETTIDSVRAFDRALTASEAENVNQADGAVLSYSFGDLLRDQSLCGGFIWDWVNQDVTATTDDGTEYQFYDDDPFCLNGLVWSDREPQPELLQLNHSHQPIKVAPRELSAGEVYVTNHFGFTDLSAVTSEWRLRSDDELLQSGRLDLDLAPGETRPVSVPIEPPSDAVGGTEYWLEFSFVLSESTAYAEAGHEVAFDQFAVPFDVPESEPVTLDELSPVSRSESDGLIVISGDGFEYTLDTERGSFSSLQYDGTELLEEGPVLNAWRVPIMNDSQAWGGEQASSWYEAGLNELSQSVGSVQTSQPDDHLVTVEIEAFVGGASETLQRTPDASSTGNDGLVYGAPDIAESGTAIAFDGADDYVDAGTAESFDFTSPGFAVEATFKNLDTGGHKPLVAKGDQQYALKVNDDQFEFFIYDPNEEGSPWKSASVSIPADLDRSAWHTLVGVCTENELRLHLDGELLTSQSHSVTEINGTDYPVHIAHNSQNSDRYSATTIESVRLYDRALSDDEVASGFDAPPESAVLWYDFDEFESVERQAPGFDTRYRYRVFGSGDIALDVRAEPNDRLVTTIDDYLPKLGVRLELPASFDDFEWYGRGPEETYPDRKWGVRIGRYTGSVDEQYVPYLPPTDNGNKSDTRWAALSNGDGTGLLGVAADGSMNVNLEQWANLAAADHQHELTERGSIAFDLDHAVTGVGGTPREPQEQHRVRPEPASFGFVLRPFTPDDPDPMTLTKRQLPEED